MKVKRESEISRRDLKTIRKYDIIEYSELLDMLSEHDGYMYNYACTHTIQINTYIKSRRYAKMTSRNVSY